MNVSRACDKLANDLVTLIEGRTIPGDRRVMFTNGLAVARSIEHLVRVVVNDMTAGMAEEKREAPKKERTVQDDAIAMALRTGLRRVRSALEDWEKRV